MNPTISQHSGAWIFFTYLNLAVSLALTLIGIFFLPIDIWVRGYLLMGVAMLVSSTAIVTKTIRDREESVKLVNKIDEAKTEQLLMGIDSRQAMNR